MEKRAIFIKDNEFGNVIVVVNENDYDLALAFYKKNYPKWKEKCSGTLSHPWNFLNEVDDLLDEEVLAIIKFDTIEC